MTQAEITKMFKNPNTKVLIDWVKQNQKITKILMAPQFFHFSHSANDKKQIIKYIEEVIKVNEVKHVGQSVIITF
jgi:hypothetical protein